MRFSLAVVVFALAITTQSFAQNKSTVSGHVKDHTGKALAAVSVSLLQAKDSSLVKADVTDANGQFELA
ncbi:MAG: hypothetical protein JWQ78_746, partial [Sediminibacterium sp.]|nr:hypothetical protein [Sediminibacterium sp.]